MICIGGSPTYAVTWLTYCSMRLKNRRAVVHNSGQIGIGKRDAAERCVPQHFSWCRSSVFAKKETRLRTQVGVSPAVQDDARNVAAGIKPRLRKHQDELLADAPFVLAERRGEQLRTAAHRSEEHTSELQ